MENKIKKPKFHIGQVVIFKLMIGRTDGGVDEMYHQGIIKCAYLNGEWYYTIDEGDDWHSSIVEKDIINLFTMDK